MEKAIPPQAIGSTNYLFSSSKAYGIDNPYQDVVSSITAAFYTKEQSPATTQ